MVNYAYAFSQSETEKYFEWIIININKCSRMFKCLICLAKQERFLKCYFWRKFHIPDIWNWNKNLSRWEYQSYISLIKRMNAKILINSLCHLKRLNPVISRIKIYLGKILFSFFSGNGEDYEYNFETKINNY